MVNSHIIPHFKADRLCDNHIHLILLTLLQAGCFPNDRMAGGGGSIWPPPLTFFLAVRLSWIFFLNFGNEKNSSKNIFWYFSDPYDVTYDEITYFSNIKFRVFSSFSFLTFLKKKFRWNVIHEIVALHNTHLGKIIRRSGKLANLVKWRH